MEQTKKAAISSTRRRNGTPKRLPQAVPGGFLVVDCQIKYLYTLERDLAGAYVASCMSLPECTGRSFDRRSAIARMVDALKISLEKEADFGQPLQVRMEEAASSSS